MINKLSLIWVWRNKKQAKHSGPFTGFPVKSQFWEVVDRAALCSDHRDEVADKLNDSI